MDLRIENIFFEEMKYDKSFQEKEFGLLSLLFGTTKYSQKEVRDIWHQGIKYGIEIGLIKASLEGQRIELNHNTSDEKHKEFLDKFHKLADEYNCYIQYHPKHGMTVITKDSYM
jgi:hypothetical protein